jgi:hypothetical protein
MASSQSASLRSPDPTPRLALFHSSSTNLSPVSLLIAPLASETILCLQAVQVRQKVKDEGVRCPELTSDRFASLGEDRTSPLRRRADSRENGWRATKLQVPALYNLRLDGVSGAIRTEKEGLRTHP